MRRYSNIGVLVSALLSAFAAAVVVHRVISLLIQLPDMPRDRFDPGESAMLTGILVFLAVWALGASIISAKKSEDPTTNARENE